MTAPRFFPTRGHLLLCTGPTCTGLGARRLFAALWRRLEAEHLAYYKRGGSIRLTESGCLGACGFGPTLACYARRGDRLEEAWYARADEARALAVARAVHEDRPLPEDDRYGP